MIKSFGDRDTARRRPRHTGLASTLVAAGRIVGLMALYAVRFATVPAALLSLPAAA